MKRLLLVAGLALATALAAFAQVPPGVMTLVNAATATGAQSPAKSISGGKTYQAAGIVTAGAGAGAMAVQGSNNGTNWDTIGTISLTLGTTTVSDSFVSLDRYVFVRGNVTSISGTGATLSLTMGF